MDWNSFFIWTGAGTSWAILAGFFYMVFVRINGAELKEREIDRAALDRVQHEWYRKFENDADAEDKN